MGLTTKHLQSQIVPQECPHYYELKLPDGSKRHCGSREDMERVFAIYPDAAYSKILLPPVPDTVDVPHTEIKDKELPPQQILPESQQEPLDL